MPAPSTLFDPAAPVAEEFDVFCEGCGYSLLGLAGDRCPECGRPFNPNEQPYARVPWLHRRRIGRWPGYWKTVGQVVRRPREFAAELCRPVRISADDARRFRRVTALVAATSLVAAVAMTVYLANGPPQRWQDTFGFALMTAIGWFGAVLFFRLATDMPVFIWKGLPSMPAHELAPLHHYAAAPLALAPFVAAIGVGLPWLAVFAGAPPGMLSLAAIPGLVAASALLITCWVTPLVLMRTATGCGPRRVLLLAAYLPVHVFLMFLVTFLSFAVCMIPLVQVIEYFERHF
jgi:hypothetical protein